MTDDTQAEVRVIDIESALEAVERVVELTDAQRRSLHDELVRLSAPAGASRGRALRRIRDGELIDAETLNQLFDELAALRADVDALRSDLRSRTAGSGARQPWDS